MSGEDRADRLRRRRQRARDRAQSDGTDESDEAGESAETAATADSDEAAKPDETANTEETAKTDGTAEPGESDEPRPSVKDEQKPTYMYLPHSIRRDLDRSYSMLKAEYEYEYQESFEKNRHFYPLVVSLGLDAVDELDPDEVRDRLGQDG